MSYSARVTWLGEDQLAVEVEADDTSHADGDVLWRRKMPAHRIFLDVVAVEPRRGHLVQQRLVWKLLASTMRHVKGTSTQGPSDGQPSRSRPR